MIGGMARIQNEEKITGPDARSTRPFLFQPRGSSLHSNSHWPDHTWGTEAAAGYRQDWELRAKYFGQTALRTAEHVLQRKANVIVGAF